MKTLKSATSLSGILALILLLSVSTEGEAGGGRQSRAAATHAEDPTLHHDANGRPYYIDHLGLNEGDETKDLYHLRWSLDSSVAALTYEKKPMTRRLDDVANGFAPWIENTKLLLVRHDKKNPNLEITTEDMEDDTLVKATPSRPGRFEKLKITLNSRFKKWTPELVQAAIARGVGIVMGLRLVEEDDQLMSKNFKGSIKSGILTPQSEDIKAAQKIFGKPKKKSFELPAGVIDTSEE